MINPSEAFAMKFTRPSFFRLLLATLTLSCLNLYGQPIRLDCSTPTSPVMQGYQRLTADDTYSAGRGFGWVGGVPTHLEFSRPKRDLSLRGSNAQMLIEEPYDLHRNPLNRDAVVSRSDLSFRADVPNGSYRVTITMGDLAREIGSIDLAINHQAVADQLAVWAPGGYRMLDRTPSGWWTTFRATIEVTDGAIRINWKQNQSHYDTELAAQKTWKTPYARWYHATPIIQEPPYHYIGYPFTHHSVMAIEISPNQAAPIEIINGQLALTQPVQSPALAQTIKHYNAGHFDAAIVALQNIAEPNAQLARATLALHLAGNLNTEAEDQLVPQAIAILKRHMDDNPQDRALAELLSDAEIFQKAMHIHIHRAGELESNHFLGNDRAIGWWWMIQPTSPLYHKARLHLARAAHMLKPYFPILGTEGQVFAELETIAPDNRFIKYHLRREWETRGDGSDFYDWYMPDYAAKTKNAPAWAASIYPAYAGLVDLSEWWIHYKQTERGDIGGGWSDDVELVGLFGYYGYISRGASDTLINGAAKLCDGAWNLSEIDPTLGYSELMSDAEHSAEPTGNTLGMMMQLDYGNPQWIERSMMTGQLIRDLWTDYNDAGLRHFRGNFLSATQVGKGHQANDSWINYRAVSPASSVLSYNQNPTIGKLYVELADAWLAAALSTERSKPKGVIPAQVSFPQGILGGQNAPNWYTADHPPRTVNYDWQPQKYKNYVVSILLAAYKTTSDTRYLEPLRLEYELAVKHGFTPPDPGVPKTVSRQRGGRTTEAAPGSEAWTAAKLLSTEAWMTAKRLIEGRSGPLENSRTKENVIFGGERTTTHLRSNWPIMTSESGPTDRVGFPGILDPFLIYTGGRRGGPLLEAAVTYEHTTKDFAAAVMANDPQGLRILYYSFTPDAREIAIVPWDLEPGGTYTLTYGPDADDNGTMDSVTQQREFHFPQAGTPVALEVQPATNYIIEIQQLKRGKPAALRADPALAPVDIHFDADRQYLQATIHNVGSLPIRNAHVAFYDGDPGQSGRRIYQTRIPNIDAPIDLDPKTVTVGVNFTIPRNSQRDIYVVIDPDGRIADEITTFNNVAHAKLPRPDAPPRLRMNGAGATPEVGR